MVISSALSTNRNQGVSGATSSSSAFPEYRLYSTGEKNTKCVSNWVIVLAVFLAFVVGFLSGFSLCAKAPNIRYSKV